LHPLQRPIGYVVQGTDVYFFEKNGNILIQKTKKFFNIEHGGTFSKPLSFKELISRRRSSTWDLV
jgi:hypothetical protein